MKAFFYLFLSTWFFMGCLPSSKEAQLQKIVDIATELYDAGYSYDSLPYMEKAMEFSTREFGEISHQTAKVSKQLSGVYYEKGMLGAARKEYSRLIHILSNLPGEKKDTLIKSYQQLARIFMALNNFDQSEKIFVHVLLLQKKYLMPNHPDTVETTHTLARLNYYFKKNNKFNDYLDESISILEKIHGVNSYEIVKKIKLKLEIYVHRKDIDGRIKTIKKLVKVMEKSIGKSSLAVAEKLDMLVDAHMDNKDYKKAAETCALALEINKKKLSKNSPVLINNYRKIAHIHFLLLDRAKMELFLKNAMELSATDSLNDDLFEESLYSLINYYMEAGDYLKAEKSLLKLIPLRQKKLSAIHPDLIVDHNSLARCYREQQKYVQAQASLEAAFDIISYSFGKTSEHGLLQIEKMAILSSKARKYPQAITHCMDAIKSIEALYPANHQYYFPFYRRLSIIFKTTRKLEQATDFSLRALKVSEFVHGAASLQLINSLTEVADLYSLRKMPKKAIPYTLRSVNILEKNPNTDRHDLAGKINDLAALYEVTGDKAKAQKLTQRAIQLDSEGSPLKQ